MPKPYSWNLGQLGFKELVSPIKSTIHRTSVWFWILTQNQSLGTCPFRTRETWLDFGVTQKIFCIRLKPLAARRLQFSPSIIMVQMEMMPLHKKAVLEVPILDLHDIWGKSSLRPGILLRCMQVKSRNYAPPVLEGNLMRKCVQLFEHDLCGQWMTRFSREDPITPINPKPKFTCIKLLEFWIASVWSKNSIKDLPLQGSLNRFFQQHINLKMDFFTPTTMNSEACGAVFDHTRSGKCRC